MENSIKYNFADFTHENYRKLLKFAKEKFKFRDFTNFGPEEAFIIWRHDIDFSVHSALNLAEIENEEGIVSTYFVHLHNEFYNPLENEITSKLMNIKQKGHKFGLHFDSQYYDTKDSNDLEKSLSFEKGILENVLNTEISSFSFHNTNDLVLSFNEGSYAGMVNVYSRYFREDVSYCSDSNGYWRYERLEDMLLSGKHVKLQVLTHPTWWQETIMSPRERIRRCIKGRAENALKKYDDFLSSQGRENID
ncbi:MAG: hypothetical protein IT281_07805 [Ignavibacteria bacterium]|nr:hypothetical protein [Ignavibacteria bacterium]